MAETDIIKKQRQQRLEAIKVPDEAPAQQVEHAGINIWGESKRLASTDTGEIVKFKAPPGFSVCGFSATGVVEAYFAVLVDDRPLISARITAPNPSCERTVPSPQPVEEGAVIKLVVRNESLVAGDFEGTLLGDGI